MDEKQQRIAKLSERFKSHATGRPRKHNRERERRSFYLDTALSKRLNKAYGEFNHTVYPNTVSKSVFLESILEHGLDNLDVIAAKIAENSRETSEE